MVWMVVRVRGSIHARHDIVQTLHDLRLTRPNHATLLPEEPAMRGMLIAMQGYVTWGEADQPTVELLLRQRGEKPVGGRLTDGEGTPPEFPQLAATALKTGSLRLAGVRPVFRLKAPKGGWRSTKKPFARGGALGYRGSAINELAKKMV
ncbi:MAG TPA: uL30 family ribosomal protein [Thermoplasmata archaeon]|nr:uL30 family ribosomal protein [Thermoplasmata archaeon]